MTGKDSVQSTVLNNVFSHQLLRSFIEGSEYPAYRYAVKTFIPHSCEKDNLGAICDLYSFLFKHHRNEYLYKNILLNKLLLGRHSLNTSTAFTEMPVSKSIADFVIINGKAVVYEIKTDLDNFSRLDSQINDYYSAFENVCVVCSEKNVDKLKRRYANTPIGIAVLTDRRQLSVRKECENYLDDLSHDVLFRVLRKNEYERVLTACGYALPDVPSVFYFRHCLELFRTIPKKEMYNTSLAILKERGQAVDPTPLAATPQELKLLGYDAKITSSQSKQLLHFLEKPFSDGKG